MTAASWLRNHKWTRFHFFRVDDSLPMRQVESYVRTYPALCGKRAEGAYHIETESIHGVEQGVICLACLAAQTVRSLRRKDELER
jgi:hypothetical protein